MKKLTFTIYWFFQYKINILVPWELPGASKKRSETTSIFDHFLTSILDRFWLTLDLQNYLKIIKMSWVTLIQRAFGPLWEHKSDPELIFHDFGPQNIDYWYPKLCFFHPSEIVFRRICINFTYFTSCYYTLVYFTLRDFTLLTLVTWLTLLVLPTLLT